MTLPRRQNQIDVASAIATYLRRSDGDWQSERRYYTLPEGTTQEIISFITVRFLEPGSEELIRLAGLHGLADEMALDCGSHVTWESTDRISGRKQSKGSTLFGVSGSTLYRDRGFATPKPITAAYHMPDPNTLCLRTEYNGSVFEEEIKQIGDKYRTRQTIISRAGEQVMIGQYLEKRIS
ncbi:MAG: phycobiliprotein lyase [Limnospira sp.]